MRLRVIVPLLTVACAGLAVAQSNSETPEGEALERAPAIAFGDDRFLAGRTVVFDEVGVDDLFMAGDVVRCTSEISGSAHLAGRRVEVSGAVGGDAYLAGMTMVSSGKVEGDLTMAGYEGRVGEVGGDLRFAGRFLVVEGAVGGSVSVNGRNVRFEGPVLGDVLLMSKAVSFADDARIDGRLIVFEDDDETTDVPASVVSEDRIERRSRSEWEDGDSSGNGWLGALRKYLTQVGVLAALATLAASLAPRGIAELRRALLDRPRRLLWHGFVIESAFIGSAILFVTTVFGLVLVPVSLLAALFLGITGYVAAVYSVGVGLLLASGRPDPSGPGARATGAVLGALVARAVAQLPYVGWLCTLTLTLLGIGALLRRRFRPAPEPAGAA